MRGAREHCTSRRSVRTHADRNARRHHDLVDAVNCSGAHHGPAPCRGHVDEREAALPRASRAVAAANYGQRRAYVVHSRWRRTAPGATTRGTARNRAGMALLEVIVALTLVSIVGANVLARLAFLIRTQRQAMSTEIELVNADRLMRAQLLLTNRELASAPARRAVGTFTVATTALANGVYRVAITDAEGEPLLVTVYAPPVSGDEP